MKFKKLPELPTIKIKDVPDMSIILEAGANKFTRAFENYVNKFPYKPAFTHAFVHITGLKNGALSEQLAIDM